MNRFGLLPRLSWLCRSKHGWCSLALVPAGTKRDVLGQHHCSRIYDRRWRLFGGGVDIPSGPCSYILTTSLLSQIFRIFVIWERHILPIVAPFILFLAELGLSYFFFESDPNLTRSYYIAAGSALIFWAKPSTRNAAGVFWATTSVYILALVQNFLLTAIILLKFHQTERSSHDAGLPAPAPFITVRRQIVQSAALHTVLFCLLIAFFMTRNVLQFALQEAVMPAIGKCTGFLEFT